MPQLIIILIGLIIVVYLVCRTTVITQVNQLNYDKSRDLTRYNYDKSQSEDISLRKDFSHFLQNTYGEDINGINLRLSSLEKADAEYKKKVDALVMKAGFGL